MAAASALKMVIQIAIFPMIGRLVGPEAYGQIALVLPFIFFAMILSDSGLGGCIIRTKNLTRELEGTIFLFSLATAVAIVVAYVLVAFPLGKFMNEPMFPYLLLATSPMLILAALNVVPSSLALRQEKYGWVALSDVAGSAVSIIAVLIGVALHWGVWSLVAQQIALSLTKLIVVVIGSSYRPSFAFRWPVLRANLLFGSHLAGAGMLGFIARNIDNVLLGKFMGAEALAFYALGFQIVGLPAVIINGSAYFTSFNAATAAHNEGRSPAPAFLKVFRACLLLSAPAMAGMAVTARYSVPVILGDKWTPMIQLLWLLAPFGFCQAIGAGMSGVIAGTGRSEIQFRLTLTTCVLTILGIFAGVFISSAAVALAVSLSAIIGYSLGLRAVMKICDISISRLAKESSGPVVAAVAMLIGLLLVQAIYPATWSPAVALVVSVVLGAAMYGLVLLGFFKKQFFEDLADVKSSLLNRQPRTA